LSFVTELAEGNIRENDVGLFAVINKKAPYQNNKGPFEVLKLD